LDITALLLVASTNRDEQIPPPAAVGICLVDGERVQYTLRWFSLAIPGRGRSEPDFGLEPGAVVADANRSPPVPFGAVLDQPRNSSDMGDATVRRDKHLDGLSDQLLTSMPEQPLDLALVNTMAPSRSTMIWPLGEPSTARRNFASANRRS